MKRLLFFIFLFLGVLTLSGFSESSTTWESGRLYEFSSTRFSWAYYEDMTRTLILATPQGSVREYYEVPVSVFYAFMNARLKGSVFVRSIKGKYPAGKVWMSVLR